jgi:hypothetical protein
MGLFSMLIVIALDQQYAEKPDSMTNIKKRLELEEKPTLQTISL